MLVYKALYKKMMDDLKDAGMWIEWAEKMKKENPEEAEYFLKSAEYRLEHSYPETKSIFTKLCENNDKEKESLCMNELIHDEFEEWHNELMNRLKKHM